MYNEEVDNITYWKRFIPPLVKTSDTGTRTQVARVKAEYPNQLDYIGVRVEYIVGC